MVGVPCKIRGKLRSEALRGKEFPQKKVLSLVLCVAVMLSVYNHSRNDCGISRL